MHQGEARERVFEFAGGAVCVDFVNTVSNRSGDSPEELLVDYGTLVSWAGQAGILSRDEQGDLRAAGRADPGGAAAALGEARSLREEIAAAFAAAPAAGGAPRARSQLAKRAGRYLSRAEVRPKADGAFEPRFPVTGPVAGLDGLLGPIAWSALELLLHGEPSRVKVCGDESCGWLFVDESRNRSRKWCSMDSCGNRAKAQRHYARSRAQ
jgi:predicted RNA-binding Zn ribbon-like protein